MADQRNILDLPYEERRVLVVGTKLPIPKVLTHGRGVTSPGATATAVAGGTAVMAVATAGAVGLVALPVVAVSVYLAVARAGRSIFTSGAKDRV